MKKALAILFTGALMTTAQAATPRVERRIDEGADRVVQAHCAHPSYLLEASMTMPA